MALEAVNPLKLTIDRLLKSSRISVESPSREILQSASYGVEAAIGVVKLLEELGESVESRTMKALEQEIRGAASGFEDALDSHVSDQLLSQSESDSNDRHPLLSSLDLQGVKQEIDDFTQQMEKLQKLFHPREEEDDDDEMESFMAELSDESCRTRLIYWYASKAASVFLGTKADYIQELHSLLQEEEDEEYDDDEEGEEEDGDEEDDDDDDEEEEDAEEDDEDDDEDEEEKEEEEEDEDVEDLKYAIKSWWVKKAASVFMMDREYYIQESHNPLPEEDYVVSSTAEFAENMVGLTDQFCEIRDGLIKRPPHIRCTSLYGMAGIGKTALAIKILQDPLISSTFQSCIFVRIGPKYDVQNIAKDILAQLNPVSDNILMEEDGDLDECLYKICEAGKFLIVLDDVWKRDIWYYLSKKLPPKEVCGCHFLVTTRLRDMAEYDTHYTMHFVRFLNNKESWDLLQRKVFVGEVCPRELEKAGKEIAENCEGLPLLIITVADLLSKAEKTLEYWSKVASSKKNSIFIDAYEKILEVIYPSYYNLPQNIKTCFLYLGAFPQNCEVRISKLINLWSAEGLDGTLYIRPRECVVNHFEKLVQDSVALKTQLNSFYNRLKACTLHSVFWYLSKREAWNEKFLHVLDSYLDASIEDIESRRRLAVYKNVIFSIKDVHDSLASMLGVRSLLCTGPYHPYQVPICFGLRLLKVLDTLSIRFYEFPLEVVKLLHLRYLALTCNGNLPSSISKLWNLQCLIVHPHQSIKKSSISESYLPVEIWDLLELEHLQIMGRNLPEPPPGAVLENLLILLDVGAHTCTKRVFESLPKLDKLRVQIELMPNAAEPHSFFEEVSLVKVLSSLQCVIVNPELIMSEAVAIVPAPLVFTSYITKLTLSGFGYPWKDIRVIAELPDRQVLKLRCYAFRGKSGK